MNNINKGKSPFYPGQPVPVDFFSGRLPEIKRIQRAAAQVEAGKQQAIFLTGEYGIGKSSLAGFMRYLVEKYNNLLGIYALLGGADSLEQVAAKTVESAINSQAYKPSVTDNIRNILSQYIGKQELFGISVNFDQLKADAPNLSKGYLPFLGNLLNRLKDDGIKGLMLIFDKINGITGNPKFSHFIKTMIDENALSRQPIPLLLMICGVEERRQEMIQHHQPIERIFDVVDIQQMNEDEMKDFFTKSFGSVGVEIDNNAMKGLCHYSSGFPKIMHHIGDAAFWVDKDNIIDEDDAFEGILSAADELGKKYFDHQVIKAIRSKDYPLILEKLAKEASDLSFKRSDVIGGLTEMEKKKLDNFLRRMKKLKVVRSGDEKGEYIFTNRLARLYINLNSIKKNKR